MLDKEGGWTWSHSDEALTESFWGPGFPNTIGGNTDDCAAMIMGPVLFWWQDTSCLTTAVNQEAVAPICQYDSECSGGLYGGQCYQLSTKEAAWENAEADCRSKGGHLASVHSLAEQDFLTSLVEPGTVLWLGASDAASEV